MSMLNTVMLIGKYYSTNELLDDNYIVSLIIKDDSNSDITISISKYLYNLFSKHCDDGDLVGVKGAISIKDNELILIATKVTF